VSPGVPQLPSSSRCLARTAAGSGLQISAQGLPPSRNEDPFAGDLTQNLKLQNGDALYIPHEDYHNKFYVFGQVNRPGQYSLKDKTDVLTAISLAGGQTPRATVRKTVVVRTTGGKTEKVNANLSALFDKGDLSQNIALQTGDIVIVPETKSPDIGKIAQYLGAMVNLRYLGGLF
jgi:protein involved in polysaccharide export with SLBB domain